jgi:hypothetical protein
MHFESYREAISDFVAVQGVVKKRRHEIRQR